MKNPLSLIKEKAYDILETFKVSASEIKKTRKYEHSQNCDVLMVYPTGLGEWHQGITDETGNYLFIPLLMRVWNELHPVVISPNERIFIVSSDNHCTLDLITYGKIAASCTYDMLINAKITDKLRKIMSYRWQYAEDIISVDVKKSPATINCNLMTNKYSANFTNHNFQTLQTKAFSFMDEPSQKTIIMIGVIAGLIGILLGSIISLIAYLLVSHYSG